MGLKGSGEIKSDLKKMAPNAWGTSPTPEATVIIDDGTGCIYQTISSAESLEKLRMLSKTYLGTAKDSGPNAKHHILVMDVESRKPLNKSVLRDMDTEKTPPLTAEEITQYGFGLSLDTSAENFEEVCQRMHAHGIEQQWCKETSKAVSHALSRALRTHILRNQYFCEWIAGMCAEMESEFPPFSKILIDGAESLEEHDVFLRTTMCIGDNGKIVKKESPVSLTRAGEADLRIIEVIHSLGAKKPGSYLVRSRDTDLIPLLLLDVPNWPQGVNVALNLGPSKVDGPDDVMNVRTAYTQLCEWATGQYHLHPWGLPHGDGGIHNGFPQVFCLVMILAGTDFVLRPPGLGWQRLWNYFKDIGNAFFYEMDLTPPRKGTDFLEWHVKVLRVLEQFVRGMLATDHRPSKRKPERGERYEKMKAQRLSSFVGEEQRVLRPTPEDVQSKLMQHVPSCPDVVMEANRTKAQQGIVPQTSDWIRVYCSHALWNYLYWLLCEENPLETRAPLNMSVWGWEYGNEGKVVSSEKVYWSDRASAEWIKQD